MVRKQRACGRQRVVAGHPVAAVPFGPVECRIGAVDALSGINPGGTASTVSLVSASGGITQLAGSRLVAGGAVLVPGAGQSVVLNDLTNSMTGIVVGTSGAGSISLANSNSGNTALLATSSGTGAIAYKGVGTLQLDNVTSTSTATGLTFVLDHLKGK